MILSKNIVTALVRAVRIRPRPVAPARLRKAPDADVLLHDVQAAMEVLEELAARVDAADAALVVLALQCLSLTCG